MLKEAILITGAGQRIGLYLAKQVLLQTDYPVVFTYRTEKPGVAELKAMGALGFQVDFTQPKSVAQLLTHLHQQVASLRALIHNASVWVDDEAISDNSALFSQMLKVHVEVPYQLNMALKPLLDSSNSGLKDIIALTDCSIDLAKTEHIAYIASKAALQNMTKNFAKKYAPNIKVNSIAPGLIVFNQNDSDAYKKKRLMQSAIAIEPGEEVIWQAVWYLLNSGYTTGINLPVEGGKLLL